MVWLVEDGCFSKRELIDLRRLRSRTPLLVLVVWWNGRRSIVFEDHEYAEYGGRGGGGGVLVFSQNASTEWEGGHESRVAGQCMTCLNCARRAVQSLFVFIRVHARLVSAGFPIVISGGYEPLSGYLLQLLFLMANKVVVAWFESVPRKGRGENSGGRRSM